MGLGVAPGCTRGEERVALGEAGPAVVVPAAGLGSAQMPADVAMTARFSWLADHVSLQCSS
jgi:hypothetical protein